MIRKNMLIGETEVPVYDLRDTDPSDLSDAVAEAGADAGTRQAFGILLRPVHFDYVKKAVYAGARCVILDGVSEDDPLFTTSVGRFGVSKILRTENGEPVVPESAKAPAFSKLKANADGLIACIVQDAEDDTVLMQAWMNAEAYEMTLRTGRMTYYSRSRKTLWVKGETSGHYQYLVSLKADCDADTLLARVFQIGAACHTGNRSCFFTTISGVSDGGPAQRILSRIEKTVLERKENPKEGSYTNYLFGKGLDKILKKVGEENSEILIASKNEDPEELVYEAADYLYHLTVLFAEKGVSWQDVFAELSRRHQDG